MARPHDSERYELADAEKRDLIKLIEQGKPLTPRIARRESSAIPLPTWSSCETRRISPSHDIRNPPTDLSSGFLPLRLTRGQYLEP